ncbi:hypothetical protein BATDEDRAFT_88546 [Batrachochytrium dendrobatidis JAM81]|uniref:Eukaryotic translation initiation factor 3 subunit G n=1 Tax=Batrachochytrium dendrobatidis (strain JAM81 / FGSC 10211) TaxID=684364 RepID=F4P3R4_BATDJ|nr:translation initiation factor eIF3 core subunit g [Batrachochytrium dendrobatidis JAM81]EGF80129.1 hypothetical protein BATDEDRAFT_88546 [Batrachochytrium dendrobatidis JAM81]KAJ8326602.1 translation initiation factor eIF3 subunit g [Batrachochytrium dendrobatidis]KAK5666615.1 translation initiation factor eIF3 subunit g [Batrachochytrium dendrobatidis]|eukprot:XP_006679180.1 hypothetical protein BATDEDRAFT_88546 [Batrachochytrium dendrobatidis JAM81]
MAAMHISAGAPAASRQTEDWLDDDEGQSLPASTTVVQADGTHVVTTYSFNDDGKKVKTVKRIRMKLVKAKVNHAVAERKKWKKFGESAGLPAGPDPGSTSLGEKVFLKLSMTSKDFDSAEQEKKTVKPVGSLTINCRICKGDHYTTRCPYKDTFKPINEITAPAATTQNMPDKYIPPSQRNRSSGGPESIGTGTRMDGRKDDTDTVRMSNLSEDATEQDVRDLVAKYGTPARVRVVTDYNTHRCKGFAFISFYDRSTAERVIQKLDGHPYDNLILSVDWSKN